MPSVRLLTRGGTAAGGEKAVTRSQIAVIAAVGVLAGWMLLAGEAKQSDFQVSSQAARRMLSGQPQLISVEPLPEVDGEMCQLVSASSPIRLAAALRQGPISARAAAGMPDQRSASVDADRVPVRVIHDAYPTYSGVAVDTVRNEIVLQDENLFQIMVFDRLDNTPPGAKMTEPKRVIGGLATKVEFNCGLYVDPKSGEIYSVNNDTEDTLVVFSRQAKGNVAPDRELKTPHGTYGIAVDEENQEMFLTAQHDSAVVVFPKMAQGEDAPIRLLQGDHTGLADPHGIALDTKNGWMFVANHGSVHRVKDDGKSGRPANIPLDRSMAVPGSGKILPPSISVYARTAQGDVPPLRVIVGPKTQLNWPGQIYLDQEHGELFVANDGGDSILVFRASDSGDVAPVRLLRGHKTGLKNPTGVVVDAKNQELVVSNMGNHSATVYARTADGDVAPLRTIRSAPRGKLAMAIGNPGALAYDSKRDEVLVPN